MKKTVFIILASVIVFNFLGCKKKEELTENKIVVFASIIPQKYFIEKIAGDRVSAAVMVKPGQNPATYEPTPEQVIALSKAKIFFTIGVPFEKQFLPSIISTMKDLTIIDTSEGVKKREIAGHYHGEGEEQHYHDAANDPHIWLSPLLVKTQGENICNALIAIDNDNKDFYLKNLEEFKKELDKLHAELSFKLQPFKGRTIFVFHPAFGYFTDEYKLIQKSIETDGKEPAPAALMKIISEVSAENVKTIFVQPEFSAKSASAVADSLGAKVVVLNPLELNYISNLREIGDKIAESFK